MYLHRPDKKLNHSPLGTVSVFIGNSEHVDSKGRRPAIFVQFPCSSESQAVAIAYKLREIEQNLKAQHAAGMYRGVGTCQCGRSPDSIAKENEMSLVR